MRTLLTAALLVALAPASALAQSAPPPRDELLRLVPPDTAICLVVQGVRERSKAVAASPLAAWVQQKYGSAIGSAPEIDKLKGVETLFTSFLGVSLTDLRDDVFGDAVVMTYQPGPVGKPDAEQGCVMLKARDPAKLATLIDKLNAVQKAGNELTGVAERTHQNQKYFQRVRGEGKGEFYLLKDDLFVFAAQEASIRAVIDQAVKPATAAGPVADSARRLGVQGSFLFCWFNPRKLDAEVQAHVAAAASAKEKAARQQFTQLWSALDDIAIYLDADKDLELGFAAAYRADAMPAEFKTVLGSRLKASALWRVIPDDALLAVAGRTTGPQLLDGLLALTAADERAAARQEVEKAIGAVAGKAEAPKMLRAVGPDWGVWVTRPRSPGWFPDVTAAVRVEGESADVPDSVLKTLAFYLQFARVSYNRDHDDQIEARTERSDRAGDVTAFANPTLFPPGLTPAYGLADGYLVLGSSPEVVKAFRKPGDAPAADGAVFLRVSGAALQGYLGDHGEVIAKWVADHQKRPAADVKKGIETIAEVLSALDRAEVRVRGDGKTIRGAVRLKFVKPLAK